MGGDIDLNKDGIPDTVTYNTTAVDGTSRVLIDPTSTLNVIDEYKREIQEHKEQIEKGDNRYGLLNALSRENRIKDLERIIKDNGGTLDE